MLNWLSKMDPVGEKKLVIKDETKQGGREGIRSNTIRSGQDFEVIAKHERGGIYAR